MVQSFDHDFLQEFESINQASNLARKDGLQKEIPTIYLHNYFYNEMLCTNEKMASKNEMGQGSHLQIHHCTPELVQLMKAAGKIVAVWVDGDAPPELYAENDEFYQRVYDLGVDMLTTDYPLYAEKVIQRHHEQQQKPLS
jgi:glycerophosphoryl diester phosphodiesterase